MGFLSSVSLKYCRMLQKKISCKSLWLYYRIFMTKFQMLYAICICMHKYICVYICRYIKYVLLCLYLYLYLYLYNNLQLNLGIPFPTMFQLEQTAVSFIMVVKTVLNSRKLYLQRTPRTLHLCKRLALVKHILFLPL